MTSEIARALAIALCDGKLGAPHHTIPADAPEGLYVHPSLIDRARALTDGPVYEDDMLRPDDWYVVDARARRSGQ